SKRDWTSDVCSADLKRGAEFDLWGACDAARYMVRFLIRATFGDITDPVSQKIMDRNRRIGIGLTGVQSALAKMGIPYSQAWMSEIGRASGRAGAGRG